ncbi:MAG: hypothetical protein M0R74_03110 [Dehalococcoidia bacterium]|nr:hypothetical protein [Dehalococcoidia bacterium]
MLIRLAVCGAMAAVRLVELAYSRRNIRSAATSREGAWSRRTYPLIIAIHGIVIAGTLLRGREKPKWPWLLLLAAAQPVRAWVLFSLGPRWNARAAVASDMAIETGGPYRYLRHPNYAVVAVELFALPMAFGLERLATLASFANGLLLAVRIRDEERLLRQLPGYEEHFRDKARFVPGLF